MGLVPVAQSLTFDQGRAARCAAHLHIGERDCRQLVSYLWQWTPLSGTSSTTTTVGNSGQQTSVNELKCGMGSRCAPRQMCRSPRVTSDGWWITSIQSINVPITIVMINSAQTVTNASCYIELVPVVFELVPVIFGYYHLYSVTTLYICASSNKE